jgi:hypothetical protein
MLLPSLISQLPFLVRLMNLRISDPPLLTSGHMLHVSSFVFIYILVFVPIVTNTPTVFTWCIQVIQPTSTPSPTSPSDALKKRLSLVLSVPRLRITCFWQHDLRAVWNLGSSSSACQQLCTMMLGLYKTVKHRGSRIPMLAGYGYGVDIERMRFQLDRQALTVEYSVHPEEDGSEESGTTTQNLDELREHRRLTRSIEYLLPAFEGWDVQVSTKASSEKVEKLPWTAIAIRAKPLPPTPGGVGKLLEVTAFRITHAPLPDSHSILKVRIVLELSGPSSGIRLNGLPQTIQTIEERDPGSFSSIQQQQQQQLLQDASSTADATFQTSSSVSSVGTIGSGATPTRQHLMGVVTERSAAAEKSILSRVKRSYIYFSSLLQEPEAKWKRSESFVACFVPLPMGIKLMRVFSDGGERCIGDTVGFDRSDACGVPCGGNVCWFGTVGSVWRVGVSRGACILGQTTR